MASLAELARLRTGLEGQPLAHLQRLVGTWGLLADFCFADLLLYAPFRGEDPDSFVIIEATVEVSGLKEQVRVLAIPVRWNGEVIGVMTRESALTFGRQPGELERTYVEIFNRFARMISAGVFPFPSDDPEPEEAPRVGDGVMLLDEQARVVYTSPNAVSALHRVGVHANTAGLRLGE